MLTPGGEFAAGLVGVFLILKVFGVCDLHFKGGASIIALWNKACSLIWWR